MTFIIAIQLNDSIVVTTDNKKAVLKKSGETQFSHEKLEKMHAWNHGIITGTGENGVICRSIEIFKNLADSDIRNLPQCLDLSRKIREMEIGEDYIQVENTKLLCSSYTQHGAQLYKIERFDTSDDYAFTCIEPMDITVWLFHPNIETISANLQNLYHDLKDYSAFSNQTEWINYYLNRLAPIYQKQSQQDPFMSSCFDVFFQSKDAYIYGHIPNTQSGTLDFQEYFEI